MRPAALPNYLLRCSSGKVVANNPQRIGVDGSDTEAAWTTALAAHLGGEAEQAIDGVVAGRVDVLTGTQAIELDWLKGNKFHEGIGQALHYGDVTGQQPVLALISAYYNISGAEQQKLEYVSGLCAAHGVSVVGTGTGPAWIQAETGIESSGELPWKRVGLDDVMPQLPRLVIVDGDTTDIRCTAWERNGEITRLLININDKKRDAVVDGKTIKMPRGKVVVL